MELKEFIQTTLVQIQEGVEAAIEAREGKHGAINPIADKTTNPHWLFQNARQLVEFDVAVTVSEETKAGGKGGLKVAAFGVGAEVKGGTEGVEANQRVSRIRFGVHVIPPAQRVTGRE